MKWFTQGLAVSLWASFDFLTIQLKVARFNESQPPDPGVVDLFV